jgi:hypothetical protein
VDPESTSGFRAGTALLMAVPFALMLGLAALTWVHQRRAARADAAPG